MLLVKIRIADLLPHIMMVTLGRYGVFLAAVLNFLNASSICGNSSSMTVSNWPFLYIYQSQTWFRSNEGAPRKLRRGRQKSYLEVPCSVSRRRGDVPLTYLEVHQASVHTVRYSLTAQMKTYLFRFFVLFRSLQPHTRWELDEAIIYAGDDSSDGRRPLSTRWAGMRNIDTHHHSLHFRQPLHRIRTKRMI